MNQNSDRSSPIALTILADGVIDTLIARYTGRPVPSPAQKEGKKTLPEPREEAVMSLPNDKSR